MSAERDVNRIVRSWIRTEEHESADRVLQTVLSRLDATPQRRSGWPARRFAQVNSYAKLAAGAAAILVIAVVGYQLLPGISGPGGPSATPSPVVTPVPTEVPRLPANGPLDAGTYAMGSRPTSRPTFRITVPSGWVSVDGVILKKHADEPTEVWLNTYLPDLRVFADACQSEGTEQAIGPTAEDLVAALRAQRNSEVSDPVEVTFNRQAAGYSTETLRATRLEISVPDGLDLARCSIGGLQIWLDSSPEGNFLAFGEAPVTVATVYIVDTGPGRIVFTFGNQPDATASDIAELNNVVASIEVAD